MSTTTPKQTARRILDWLDDASFEDIQCRLHVAEKVARGLDDVRTGRIVSYTF